MSDMSIAQVEGSQGFQPPSPTQMFNNLAQQVGASSSTGITKDDLSNYLQQLQNNGQGQSGQAQAISNLINNFSQTASSETGTITAQSMQQSFQNMRAQGGGPIGHKPNISQMFNKLAQEVGADSSTSSTSSTGSRTSTGITKDQLTNYLNNWKAVPELVMTCRLKWLTI